MTKPVAMHAILAMAILGTSGVRGEMIMKADSLAQPRIEMDLGGELGRRVDANVTNWLIPAIVSNPGMVEMFHLRDRKPAYPDPVWWAGEFAGKYLISLVQALRMSDSPELRETAQKLVRDICAAQADDGYLGPFTKEQRLLGQWALWGHYHVMLGLVMWHQATGDEDALATALRSADLICDTYLDTERTVLDAGWPEMNMAIIHVLGRLHRMTGNERYRAMVFQIEKEFELPGAGDYFRQGLDGVEFYRTPKPRWESLHCIQGLSELYRITGDARYRDALVNLHRSISKTDIHNSGSFSTQEGAIGNPFKPGAIETCCTVAWTAMSIDALQFTRDAGIADGLERTLYNAIMGYQHPSGRWSTYNTPMDGHRQASAHSIVFQSRPGTPELNCCSVNAPRGLGMVSEWGVLLEEGSVYLNFYGSGRMEFADAEGVQWMVEQTTAYPAEGAVQIAIEVSESVERTVHLRIPEWSKSTKVSMNGAALEDRVTGPHYLPVTRRWESGDVIDLEFDMSPRFLVGDAHVENRASIYLGPLLLAYDQKLNDFDPAEIPALDASAFRYERIELEGLPFKPMLSVRTVSPSG